MSISANDLIRERKRRKRAELDCKKARGDLRLFRDLIDITNDAIYVIDADMGRFIDINKKAVEDTGYSNVELLSMLVQDLDVSLDASLLKKYIQEVKDKGSMIIEGIHRRKDGTTFPVQVNVSYTLHNHRRLLVAVARDVTEMKKASEKEAELYAMTIIDDLTGLMNRRGFMLLAEQQIKLADRTGEKLLLLYADFDKLKWINDNLGHLQGDRALIDASKILKDTLRGSDIVARIGGDEFVALTIESSEGGLKALSERLQTKLEDLNRQHNEDTYKLSLSVGLCTYDPKEPIQIEDLLSIADTLMYEEKLKKQKQNS